MEEVTILDAPVVSMFLGLENHIRGKSGKIEFVFRNDVVSKAFAPYRNIFSISADRSLIGQGGLLGWLKRRGKMARRRTGVRMSRPVAWFVLCVACGWIFSLAIILFYQNRRIHQQQQIITELTIQKNTATREITTLRNHLRPMVQLGIVRDSLAVQR